MHSVLVMMATCALMTQLGCGGCRAADELRDQPDVRFRELVKLWGGHLDEGKLSPLNLAGREISAEQLRVLLNQPGAEMLISINISNTHVGDAGLEAIAESAYVGHVRRLSANDIGATSAGIRALAKARSLRPSWLQLRSNKTGPAGVAALGNSPAMARVEELSLVSNPLGAEGVRALAAGRWRQLKRLSVDFVRLNDAGLRRLLTSQSLVNLEFLSIGSPSCNAKSPVPVNCYAVETLALLADDKNLPKLKTLSTSHPLAIPKHIQEQLHAKRPQLEISP